jgi:predicted dehydrogenase
MVMNVGVIGYGYWGPNLVRNFSELRDSQVVMVSDLRQDRLTKVAARYPSIQMTTNYQDIINNSAVDAVIIATPVSTHYPLALEALRAGKHVWIEKPIATTSEQALHLMEEAAQRSLVLMVDHTFVYTGAVRKIAQLISNGDTGQVYYYDATRVNLGLFQRDVNVLWDLAVHDLSIIEHVFQSKPRAVSATGISHIPDQPENVAYMTLFFEDSLIAHVNVNWLSPVKVRRTLIGGSKKMIVYDELEPSEKLKIYDKGITLDRVGEEGMYQMLIDYRTGDMWSPQIENTEALQSAALHFKDCIEHQTTPITGGESGLRIVQILQAATQSIAQHGALVELNTGHVS